MYQVLLLCLLILYFWYFYARTNTERVSEPDSPLPLPPKHQVKFLKVTDNTFQFSVNETILWEHTFTTDKYKVRRGTFDIIQKDACEHIPNGRFIPATGQALYDFLKMNPEIQHQLAFQQDTRYVVQDLNVFYFKCMGGRIIDVGICESGYFFQKSKCLPISSCTGKPDDTKIPDPSNPRRYFKCRNGREFPSYCGDRSIFVHDRCVSQNDMPYYCKFNEGHTMQLDDVTKMECINGQAVYTTCAPGTQFFETTVCEPADCVGKDDGTKLPLPPQTVQPFHFSPGYMTCYAGKVVERIECPQTWDDSLSNGDNLTHLPMVFDGDKCSAPAFCINVFSSDPSVMVPRHEFTKYVRNWEFSEFYDASAGYVCNGTHARLVYTAPGYVIGDHYKQVDACDGQNQFLPVPQNLQQYYDCTHRTLHSCERLEFFNGVACVLKPEDAFMHERVPLFKFDSLNFESWITPWNSKRATHENACRPSDVYLKLYDICSDPDCVNYAFLSMIPDLAMLLPTDKFKCKFDEGTKTLVKEPVSYHYRFWDQKILQEEQGHEKECRPGQHINTGNFIWDKTIFATCDETQPFIFCPSPATRFLMETEEKVWACENFIANKVEFKKADAVTFSDNEIKRIEPIVPNSWFKINNGNEQILPPEGYDVPEGDRTFTLQVGQPVLLELRYRVTYPPNVVFKYEDSEAMVKHSTLDSGFLVKKQGHTKRTLDFPRYTPQNFVQSFTSQHLY